MAAPNSPEQALEGTFAMIKPDAVDRAGLIFTRIVKEGFLVVEQQRFRYVLTLIKGSKFLYPIVEKRSSSILLELSF